MWSDRRHKVWSAGISTAGQLGCLPLVSWDLYHWSAGVCVLTGPCWPQYQQVHETYCTCSPVTWYISCNARKQVTATWMQESDTHHRELYQLAQVISPCTLSVSTGQTTVHSISQATVHSTSQHRSDHCTLYQSSQVRSPCTLPVSTGQITVHSTS